MYLLASQATVYPVSEVLSYTRAMRVASVLRWWKSQVVRSVEFIGSLLGRTFLSVSPRYRKLLYALLLTNGLSLVLFGLRLLGAENFRYWFMIWNLLLAWVAPLVAWWLVKRLHNSKWLTWQNVLLTIVWLGFLPNSFYMVSDLIHLEQTGEISILFDAVLFSSFIMNGFIAGFMGTFLVHRQLLRRMSARRAWVMVTAIFALSGYAIYLGRVLRWNTWDAVFQPAALLFDVSDNILNPVAHPQAFVVTLSFTLLITSFYMLAWELVQALSSHSSK